MNNMLKIFILLYIFIHNTSFSNANRNSIVSFLENFDTLQSDFVQINNNGEILSGKLFVSRPGKFRIEYLQIPLLIICDSKRLAVINKDLKSISFHLLDELPIGILLFKELSFSEIEILKIIEKDNIITAKVINSKFKDKGFLELRFEKSPFVMKKWTVFKTDDTKTEVFFDRLTLDYKIKAKLFDIELEDPRQIPFKIY